MTFVAKRLRTKRCRRLPRSNSTSGASAAAAKCFPAYCANPECGFAVGHLGRDAGPVRSNNEAKALRALDVGFWRPRFRGLEWDQGYRKSAGLVPTLPEHTNWKLGWAVEAVLHAGAKLQYLLGRSARGREQHQAKRLRD